MAYNVAGLQQIWSYTSTDAVTAIDAAGYFNSASDVLKAGDLIYIVASTGGTATFSLAPVLTNASGVVDIGDGTAISTTDSD